MLSRKRQFKSQQYPNDHEDCGHYQGHQNPYSHRQCKTAAEFESVSNREPNKFVPHTVKQVTIRL